MMKTGKRVKARWTVALAAAGWLLTGVARAADPPQPMLDVSSPVGRLEYTPGRGLRVGDTNLVLGGYSTVELSREDGGRAEFGLSNLSLFVIWDPLARLHLFAELEGEDLVV